MADVYWTYFICFPFKLILFFFFFFHFQSRRFPLGLRFSCGKCFSFHCDYWCLYGTLSTFSATLIPHSIILLRCASNFRVWAMCVFSLPDIDECKINVCHQNASCTNTKGSYICTCSPGYIGDGFDCKGKFGFFPAFQVARVSIQ